MNIDLSQRRCLVTGSNRGIGIAVSRELLHAGAHVAMHSRSDSAPLTELQRQYPEQCRLVKAELTDPTECRALVQSAATAMGGLDVLVNNAGVCYDADVNSTHWDSVWDKTFAVNSRAVGITCQEAIKLFASQESGYVVNISSRAAFRGDTPEFMAYAASKGAVVALTRSIARGFGKKGIKAFVVAPGFIETDMAKDFIDKYGRDFVMNDLALNQLTQPEDVSPMIAFLVSGKADHLTGTTVDINAGSYVH